MNNNNTSITNINNKLWWFVGAALIAYGAITTGVAINSSHISTLEDTKVDKELLEEVIKRIDDKLDDIDETTKNIAEELNELNKNNK